MDAPLQRPTRRRVPVAASEQPSQSAPKRIELADPFAPDLSDVPAEEVRLLKLARAALRVGRPTHALALLQEHSRTFPNSRLAVFRWITRIESLCAAGSKPQGLGEAARLVKLLGRSHRLKRRLQDACGLRQAPAVVPKAPASRRVAMAK